MLQGLYGGATMAGGGLALMIVPALTAATGWRALTGAPSSSRSPRRCRPLRREGRHGSATRARASSRCSPPPARRDPGGELRARGCRRQLGGAAPRAPGSGAPRQVPRRGSYFAGILSRRRVARREGRREPSRRARARGRRLGSAVLALGGPLWASTAAALVLGLGAGLPFAVVFAAAQRLRPDAPAAAMAAVNGAAISRSSSAPRSPGSPSTFRATAGSHSPRSRASAAALFVLRRTSL